MKTKKILDDEGVEHAYELNKYPAGEGFDLLPVIIQIASGPLGDLIDAIGRDGLDADIDGAKLASALNGLAAAIVAQGSAEFVKRILRYTVRDSGKVPDVFDRAYQGNYGELFAAILWVLQENYAPFLKRYIAENGGAVGAFLQKLPGASSR